MPAERRERTEPESLLGRLDVDKHLRDPRIKQRFVTTMFDVVAPSYDRFTRAASYGMDAGWKRELIAELKARITPDAHVIDLACGTGDLAFAAAELVPLGQVTALDISRRMITAAVRRKPRSTLKRVRFCVGDMMQLPVLDDSADAVTVGYGIRNAPRYGSTLAEIARVLKPGGLLLTLDFFRPANPMWRAVFLAYLKIAGNLFGWLWHREPVAYGYIAPSIRCFISWQQFATAFEQRGFVVETVRRKIAGGICLHVARKG